MSRNCGQPHQLGRRLQACLLGQSRSVTFIRDLVCEEFACTVLHRLELLDECHYIRVCTVPAISLSFLRVDNPPHPPLGVQATPTPCRQARGGGGEGVNGGGAGG